MSAAPQYIPALFPDNVLVIASHNKGKIAEIQALVQSVGIKVLSAADLDVSEPEETGDSFTENATLKALHTTEHTGKAALADDSGLVVPAIGGAPGIYSARWAGPTKDFSIAFRRIQNELANQNPAAYFTCVLALSLPDGTIHTFKGRIDGTLHFPPRGDHGFGYDPIFIPTGYDKTFAEIAAEEKNLISHRAKAFQQFAQFLKGNS